MSIAGGWCDDRVDRSAHRRSRAAALADQHHLVRVDGLSPGGPTAIFQQQARQLSPAARAEFIHTLGLDKPWYVQYVYWLGNLVFHGSLGVSYVDQRPVVVKILEKMPVTLEMLSIALVCTILIAIPIGIYSAVRRGSAFDYAATVLAFASYGMPVFWLSVIAIDLFAAHLHWFPASGGSTRSGTSATRSTDFIT